MLVGVHSIMTFPDEGGIQCLDQSRLTAFDAAEPQQHTQPFSHCAGLIHRLVCFGLRLPFRTLPPGEWPGKRAF